MLAPATYRNTPAMDARRFGSDLEFTLINP